MPLDMHRFAGSDPDDLRELCDVQGRTIETQQATIRGLLVLVFALLVAWVGTNIVWTLVVLLGGN